MLLWIIRSWLNFSVQWGVNCAISLNGERYGIFFAVKISGKLQIVAKFNFPLCKICGHGHTLRMIDKRNAINAAMAAIMANTHIVVPV